MKKSKGEDAIKGKDTIFTFCEYDESDRPLTSDQAVVASISKELKIYGVEKVNGNVDPIYFFCGWMQLPDFLFSPRWRSICCLFQAQVCNAREHFHMLA